MEATSSAKWTEEDVKKLLKTMKQSIANRARDKIWNVGLKAFDWEIVAFEPFTAEECSAKWGEIMQKLRKIKTLTELIVDAQSAMDSCPMLFEDSPIKLPKKPVAANALYFAETKEKLKRKNPGMRSRDLMKLANDKYRNLPLQCKEKYVLLAEKAQAKYHKSMNKLRRHHPDELKKLMKNANQKKADEADEAHEAHEAGNSESIQTTKKPPTIPLNGYNLFCREQKSHMTGIPKKDIMSVWSRRWKSLSKEEKEEYSRRCKEMKMAHKKPHKKIFPGEPKLKTNSICGLYLKEKLQGMKKGQSRQERFAEVCRESKNISQEERDRYQAQIDNDFRIYQERLQKWFENLPPEEQIEYYVLNPSKVKYLHCKLSVLSHRTSDSEDSDVEDSSSDQDCTVIQSDNEDEDQDQTMLDLY